MIIAFLNRKGGVGKSTLAQQTALYLSERGSTLAVDLDPQASLTTLLGHDRAGDASGSVAGGVALLWDGDADPVTVTDSLRLFAGSARLEVADSLGLDAAISALERTIGHEHMVIDCPPAAGVLQGAALLVADVAVIPVEPDLLSISGAAQMLDLVNAAQSVKPSLRYYFVINRLRRHSCSQRETAKEFETALPVAGIIPERQVVRESAEARVLVTQNKRATPVVRAAFSEFFLETTGV